jgi:predicted nucleic acid-binding protein
MRILLDTTVIIDYLRFRRGRREFLKARELAGDRFACSVISVAETYAGMIPTEGLATAEFFQQLECIEVTQEIACYAGGLKYEWARKGKTIPVTDCIIAAVALSFDLVLATDNVKDFPMPQLKLLQLPSV